MRFSTLKAALVAGAASAAAVAIGGPADAFPKPKYPTTIEEAKKPASSKPDASGANTSPRTVDSSAAANSSTAQKPLRGSSAVSSAQLAPLKAPAPAADAKPAPTRTAEAKPVEPKLPANGSKTWSVYVVQPHDTLNGVSRRFKTPMKELAELNELDPKAGLKKGLKIKLAPGTVDGGKETYASGPSPLALGGAAPIHGAKSRPAEVASAHDAKPAQAGTGPATIDKPASRPGLQIATAPYRPLPKARDQAVAQSSAPTPAAVTPASETPASTAPTAAPALVAASAPANDFAALGKGKFIWPLKGEVVSKFGAYAPGQRNDGINIASGEGAEVKAAASGDVIYAGSDKDYGNIVLIKHPDGWATVYAHLQSISVHIRDHVDQGQGIGSVGKSGGVDQAQLHFETRYSPAPKVKHNPVDPLTLLP